PQPLLIEIRLSQHDLAIRLAGSFVGETFSCAFKKIGEGEQGVAGAGSLFEDSNRDGPRATSVVVNDYLFHGNEQGRIAFWQHTSVNGVQVHRVRFGAAEVVFADQIGV